MAKLYRKKFSKRSFRKRPFKRTFKKKGRGVPRTYNKFKRSFKRIRKYNNAKLSLQSRLQSGSSLPYQTAARFYWKGSGTINFTHRGGRNEGIVNNGGA